eukprot:1997216-Pleurochrysis_carterae.AAC.1
MRGYRHRGACVRKRGQYATPPVGFPQSAGFSTIHPLPLSAAASTNRAVTSASVLCRRRYSVPTPAAPVGLPLVPPSCGAAA